MARRSRYSDASNLLIGTTLVRQTAEYGPVECDIAITFDAEMTSPGCPEVRYQRNGDPGWPAEDAEYDLTITSIAFDLGFGHTEPSDAPGPLTAIEIETLRKWFDEHQARALEIANDNTRDY